MSLAWARAARAQARAKCAFARADRYDQIVPVAPDGTRALYEELATAQRRLAERHLAAARIHSAVAVRILDSHRRVQRATAAGIAGAVADALGVNSVAVVLRASDESDATAVGSDARALKVQDAELVVSEGPSHDVTRTSHTLAVDGSELTARWPRFAEAVAPLVLHALAAVPLRAGEATVGSLTVIDAPWPRPEHGLAGLATVGEALVQTVLEEMGEGGGALEATQIVSGDWMATVHVAAGMLAARHQISPEDAMALIRARAYAESIGMDEVSLAITQGRLSLLE